MANRNKNNHPEEHKLYKIQNITPEEMTAQNTEHHTRGNHCPFDTNRRDPWDQLGKTKT